MGIQAINETDLDLILHASNKDGVCVFELFMPASEKRIHEIPDSNLESAFTITIKRYDP